MHEQPLSLGMGLRATWSVRNLGFRSPIPQIVCVESDAEKIGRKESELRRSHSDDAYDDAVCSRNDPALPLLPPDENCREDGQKAGQIIKPQHFPPGHRVSVCSKSSRQQFKDPRDDMIVVGRTGAANVELRLAAQGNPRPPRRGFTYSSSP